MENQKLYEEQLAFLRESKEVIFGEFRKTKIGFDLYLPMKVSYYACFALRKKYTTVHEELTTEHFVTQEFSDVLDMLVSEQDNFSLKESLKAEIKLNVITDYLLSISKKKVYPSAIRKKEAHLKNAIKRAQKVVDDYFKDDDVMYKEMLPFIDIYEVIVQNHGKQVDFHFGRHGFTLTNQNTHALRVYLDEQNL